MAALLLVAFRPKTPSLFVILFAVVTAAWFSIFFWLVADALAKRNRIYLFFGFRERPLTHLWRFLRLSTFIVLSFFVVVGSLLILVNEPVTGFQSPIAILSSAIVATVSVIYTNYNNGRSQRRTHTFDFLRDILRDDAEIKRFKAIRQAVEHIAKQRGLETSNHVKRLELLDFDRVFEHEPLKIWVLDRLNSWEFIAVAARGGDVDMGYLNLTMATRIKRELELFGALVEQRSGARPVHHPTTGKSVLVATKSTYEHLLWLAYHLFKDKNHQLPRGFVYPRWVGRENDTA